MILSKKDERGNILDVKENFELIATYGNQIANQVFESLGNQFWESFSNDDEMKAFKKELGILINAKAAWYLKFQDKHLEHLNTELETLNKALLTKPDAETTAKLQTSIENVMQDIKKTKAPYDYIFTRSTRTLRNGVDHAYQEQLNKAKIANVAPSAPPSPAQTKTTNNSVTQSKAKTTTLIFSRLKVLKENIVSKFTTKKPDVPREPLQRTQAKRDLGQYKTSSTRLSKDEIVELPDIQPTNSNKRRPA